MSSLQPIHTHNTQTHIEKNKHNTQIDKTEGTLTNRNREKHTRIKNIIVYSENKNIERDYWEKNICINVCIKREGERNEPAETHTKSVRDRERKIVK